MKTSCLMLLPPTPWSHVPLLAFYCKLGFWPSGCMRGVFDAFCCHACFQFPKVDDLEVPSLETHKNQISNFSMRKQLSEHNSYQIVSKQHTVPIEGFSIFLMRSHTFSQSSTTFLFKYHILCCNFNFNNLFQFDAALHQQINSCRPRHFVLDGKAPLSPRCPCQGAVHCGQTAMKYSNIWNNTTCESHTCYESIMNGSEIMSKIVWRHIMIYIYII